MGWLSLPWPLLMFLGADVDPVGSCKSHSPAALVCSEDAQTEQRNRQAPGKYLLDDAFRENKCWHKSSLHSCSCLLWLTWDWCRCSHFAHSWNISFLVSQFVPTTGNLSVPRRAPGCRQPLGQEAFWEPAEPTLQCCCLPLVGRRTDLSRASLHQETSSELQLFLLLYL